MYMHNVALKPLGLAVCTRSTHYVLMYKMSASACLSKMGFVVFVLFLLCFCRCDFANGPLSSITSFYFTALDCRILPFGTPWFSRLPRWACTAFCGTKVSECVRLKPIETFKDFEYNIIMVLLFQHLIMLLANKVWGWYIEITVCLSVFWCYRGILKVYEFLLMVLLITILNKFKSK